jgi:cyclophilin family peptidyl-prolyl cis-trans isomerase/HEAT repeat protein
MKTNVLMILFLLIGFCAALLAQVPINTSVQILKSEDARRYDKTLKDLLASPDAAVRARAALAAGRIGDEKAVADLVPLLADSAAAVAAMAAFGIGEIESSKASDAILKVLNASATPDAVRARAVEAAGKIAAANPTAETSKALLEAILKTLDDENRRGVKQYRETVVLGLTAAARAGGIDPKRHRPDDTDFITTEFLKSPDARIRADAANTLTRLRAPQADVALRNMLSDTDPIARANAIRALGAAQDRKAFDPLLKAATEDVDQRVRVSAIRALAGLKNPKAADKLLDRGEKLLGGYKKSKFAHPVEKNELIEISTALGRIVPDTGNERAVKFLDELVKLDDGHNAEFAVARMRVKPGDFMISPDAFNTWWGLSTTAQVAAELAPMFPRTAEIKKMRDSTPILLRRMADSVSSSYRGQDKSNIIGAPDLIRAFAAFKTKDLDAFLRMSIAHEDVFVRATAAELIGDRPASPENIAALKKAYDRAAIQDKEYDDARLAILDAIFKVDKKAAAEVAVVALNSADYLTRKKAVDLLADKELQKASPGAAALLEQAYEKRKNTVLPYTAAYGTKLGQMLNTDADYRLALSRKNGKVKAVVTTEKGTFTIDLYPQDAPLTVDNFIKLARSNYFNGIEVHRVVSDFVIQDGDPRGDGNGGPGWSIRCEINMRPFDRGAVGMALSGKDTGGSQWFVTHSPQPHLDGGYTVFGHVNEKDMQVVDSIVRGDKIISIKIVGEKAPKQPTPKPTPKAEPEE